MTLKILKPKTNNSLILDDEFIQYCKLNNIEDVEKFAREVFNQGFTIIKYGNVPSIDVKVETKRVNVSPSQITIDPENVPEIIEKPEIVIPKSIKKQIEQEQIQNMKKKADLYDE